MILKNVINFLNLDLERQQAHPISSEERHKKRSLLILESKSMSNEVKNWWSSILNDIEF